MRVVQSAVRHFYLSLLLLYLSIFFFFNDPPTTEIYTLSLHDALPISARNRRRYRRSRSATESARASPATRHWPPAARSEEHTSELQSHSDLVCRLLLEKKKKNIMTINTTIQQRTNTY